MDAFVLVFELNKVGLSDVVVNLELKELTQSRLDWRLVAMIN